MCILYKENTLVPLTRLVKVSKSPGLSLVGDLAVSVLFSSSFGVEGAEGNGISCGEGGIASGEEEPAACS